MFRLVKTLVLCGVNISINYIIIFSLSPFLSVFVSLSQGLGGGLESDLLITPWLTLSLMLWWGLTDVGILWKVRRQQQTKEIYSVVASRIYLTTKCDILLLTYDERRTICDPNIYFPTISIQSASLDPIITLKCFLKQG